MNTLKKLEAMFAKMDDDLGIVGDLIGVICLFAIGYGAIVFLPLIFG